MTPAPHPAVTAAMAMAAFTLPALALTVPSGYSYGALLLCVLGTIAWVRTPRLVGSAPALVWLAVAVGALSALWAWDAAFAEPFRLNGLDRPIKFALIWLALPAVLWAPPPTQALRWGVWLGALGAAATALWQTQVGGMDRAWGHTNAIQFGNLALLLGVWSAVWAGHAGRHLTWLPWAAAAAGLYATVASESRGGWWVALVLCPLALALVWLTRRHQAPRQSAGPGRLTSGVTSTHRTGWAIRWARGLVLVAAVGALGTQAPRLVERTQQAWQEVHLYLQTGESANSVGQRLAHWRLAWDMGWDAPLTGWGEQGYQQEKARRIDAGQAPPVLLIFQHAHNEWLDMWAKHGLLGLLALCAVYAVPGGVYARTLAQHRRTASRERPASAATAACAVCGLLMVLGYLGFGMTQVMFAHNSSSIMYVFMNLLWMGAMLAPRLGPVVVTSAE